jgi:hypothetical protein
MWAADKRGDQSVACWSRTIVAWAFAIWWVSVGPSLLAQGGDSASDSAQYRLGSLAFTPALVVSNGYDTNAYREPVALADLETFAVPQIEGWWTQPRFQMSMHGAVEAVRFAHHVGAINSQVGVRFERTHSLIRPYISWNRRRTNANPTGFEIGYKSLRLENDWSTGAEVTLSDRTTLRGFVRLIRTNWDADAIYQSSSLREKLNRDTRGVGAMMAYALSRYTALGFTVETQDDRFRFSPIRDGHSTRVAPVLEFSGTRALFGNVVAGYERFLSPASGAADFNGMFARANIGYGLAEGTLLKLYISRDLQYSYDPALAYYVASGVGLTLANRLAGRWDTAAFGGEYFLDYRPPALGPSNRPVENVVEFGGAIAYRVGQRTRIGWTLEHASKNGPDGYRGLRAVGFLTYGSGRFQRLDRPTPFER